MNGLARVSKQRSELKGIRCPNPANYKVRSLPELKTRFNIESGCVSCLRCLCGRLLELPEKERNPDCLSFLQDSANDACGNCNVSGLCAEAIAYAI